MDHSTLIHYICSVGVLPYILAGRGLPVCRKGPFIHVSTRRYLAGAGFSFLHKPAIESRWHITGWRRRGNGGNQPPRPELTLLDCLLSRHGQLVSQDAVHRPAVPECEYVFKHLRVPRAASLSYI